MRFIIAALFTALVTVEADAQSVRHDITVPTPNGPVLAESFGRCGKPACPAVLILSGSKGFGAPAYDEIGRTFLAAGLDAYLVHVLSAADLAAIHAAGGARARIAYYAQRLPNWISAVQGVAADLKAQPRHGGKVGVLGVSLGAQIASAATSGRRDVDALVLVDGGFPKGYPRSTGLPPLLLIWGGADRVFPPSIGRDLQQTVQGRGGSATLDVSDGSAHDFFLRAGTQDARAAHQRAADFLESRLSQ